MEKNIIFIHIPKTAGVSISKALTDANALKPGYGFTHNKAIDVLKLTDDNSPVLCVVRNPYDRLYSIYEFYRTQQKNFRDHNQNFIKDNFIISDLINKTKTSIDNIITFKEFILSFENTYLNKEDQFTTCYDFIIDNNNNILCTDIIRFENLSNEYQNFCNKYKISNFLKSNNNNLKKNNDIDWTKLYDNEMRKIVENIFRNDLIHFNYSYESFIRSKPRKIIKDNNLFFRLY